MGAKITEKPDGLIIDGPTPLKGAVVQSHGDHRLAMSLAAAAVVAEGETTIEDVDCVATSFPTFWTLLGAANSVAVMDFRSLNPYYSPFLYRWGQRVCGTAFRVLWRRHVSGMENVPPLRNAGDFRRQPPVADRSVPLIGSACLTRFFISPRKSCLPCR